MNSALQALFNTPGMRVIFNGQKFINFINARNNAGSKGAITACFTALMDSVWSGHYNAIRPDRFLQVFAKDVNPEFADRRQHDAQEFQMLLLDALHEDTNRVSLWIVRIL
jgi:ubiquitin C-terminal hydrolase